MTCDPLIEILSAEGYMIVIPSKYIVKYPCVVITLPKASEISKVKVQIQLLLHHVYHIELPNILTDAPVDDPTINHVIAGFKDEPDSVHWYVTAVPVLISPVNVNIPPLAYPN